jgi:hypothetical protein
MAASLYKDSTVHAFHSMKASKFFRWLTGETGGDLGTRGPGWDGANAGVTVKIIEAWDAGSNGGLRSVSSGGVGVAGTMNGLDNDSAWKSDASEITDGWIVIEFDGTGINSNAGFQYFFQYGPNARDMDYSNVVIPRKNWKTQDGVAGATLSSRAAIEAELDDMMGTLPQVCTEPNEISNAHNTANATWYGWADNGMVMLMADDTSSLNDAWFTYAGEVDDPSPGDNYPFIASSGAQDGNCHYVLGDFSGLSEWSRISPVDETTLLNSGRAMAFALIREQFPFEVAEPTFKDFGGYYRSPIGVGFTTAMNQHIAGTLRYINITHGSLGPRWTSDVLTRIGWAIPMANGATINCGWSMDWDGTTPHS